MSLIVPLLNSSALDVLTTSELHAQSELGNLVAPLNSFQAVGIWPVGDFRFSPGGGGADRRFHRVGASGGGIRHGAGVAREGDCTAVVLPGGVGFSLGDCSLRGSPWVDAKALATISPALLLPALIGAVALIKTDRRAAGWLITGLLVLGLLWSNVLAYREVNLAPYDQLSELEQIGEQIAGQGPTLMTDSATYGVRHFLRDADPESVSALRRRVIPLRGGSQVPDGGRADTDELQLAGLLVYRTLVLRRSPEQSRPPLSYQLLDSSRTWEVWQRPAVAPAAGVRHLSLGKGIQPTGRVPCDKIGDLADAAGPSGQLAYAERPPNVVFDLSGFEYPLGLVRPQRHYAAP